MIARFWWLICTLLIGCETQSEPAPATQAIVQPAPSVPDNLAGSYQWISLNGQPAPAEFPAGSKSQLLSGGLDLEPDNANAISGNFLLTFVYQKADADSTVQSAQAGAYQVVQPDSLIFSPSAAPDAPLVRFRYQRIKGDTLILTDGYDRAWGYIPRRKP